MYQYYPWKEYFSFPNIHLGQVFSLIQKCTRMPLRQTPLRINKPSHLLLPSTFNTTVALIYFPTLPFPLWISSFIQYKIPTHLDIYPVISRHQASLQSDSLVWTPQSSPALDPCSQTAPYPDFMLPFHTFRKANFSPQTQCENLDHTDLDWCSFLHFQWLCLKDHRRVTPPFWEPTSLPVPFLPLTQMTFLSPSSGLPAKSPLSVCFSTWVSNTSYISQASPSK